MSWHRPWKIKEKKKKWDKFWRFRRRQWFIIQKQEQKQIKNAINRKHKQQQLRWQERRWRRKRKGKNGGSDDNSKARWLLSQSDSTKKTSGILRTAATRECETAIDKSTIKRVTQQPEPLNPAVTTQNANVTERPGDIPNATGTPTLTPKQHPRETEAARTSPETTTD